MQLISAFCSRAHACFERISHSPFSSISSLPLPLPLSLSPSPSPSPSTSTIPRITTFIRSPPPPLLPYLPRPLQNCTHTHTHTYTHTHTHRCGTTTSIQTLYLRWTSVLAVAGLLQGRPPRPKPASCLSLSCFEAFDFGLYLMYAAWILYAAYRLRRVDVFLFTRQLTRKRYRILA